MYSWSKTWLNLPTIREVSLTGIGGETSATFEIFVASECRASIDISGLTKQLTGLRLPYLILLKRLAMFSDMMSWWSPILPAGLEAWSSSSGYSEMGSSSGRWRRKLPWSLISAVALREVTASMFLRRLMRFSSSSWSFSFLRPRFLS